MANKTIYQLTNKAVPDLSDEFELQETSNGSSYKALLSAIASVIAANLGNATCDSLECDGTVAANALTSATTVVATGNVQGANGVFTNGDVGCATVTATSTITATGQINANGGLKNTYRVLTSDNQTSVSPTCDYDVINVTSMSGSGTFTINNPTGTPTAWQEMQIYMKSENLNALSWGDAFMAGQNTLYSSIAATGKLHYMHFVYDPTAQKWYQRFRGYQS